MNDEYIIAYFYTPKILLKRNLETLGVLFVATPIIYSILIF